MVTVALAKAYGWARWQGHDVTVWFKGYVEDGRTSLEEQEAARFLSRIMTEESDPERIGLSLRELSGNFACVVDLRTRVLVIVDRVRSIPLFYACGLAGYVIGDQPMQLLKYLGSTQVDLAGSLEVAMAGYCTGSTTIYQELKQLQSGEFALFSRLGGQPEPVVRRYYVYRPWMIDEDADFSKLQARLSEITRALFRSMVNSLQGRPVMVPLSAGLDSRLVASGLAEMGYRNARCYAYGRHGNYEAMASKRIAERLGFRWTFVPYSPNEVRAMMKNEDFLRYLEFADTCASVPFLQDFLAIQALRRRGFVPKDAVFINGNSGDFISGGHIPKSLWEVPQGLSPAERRDWAVKAYIDKHFSLWQDLLTPDRAERVASRVHASIRESVPQDLPPSSEHGLYEFLECQGRQAKFVITGQRVYEYFGYAWRLPLWDKVYLDFWETVPLSAKIQQKLYRAFLEAENWGNVWSDGPPLRYVTPRWIVPLRSLAIAACMPFGKEVWHGLEKRVFAYWTDPLSTYAAAPYGRLLLDRRGFRNAVSVRCEAYLAAKGLNVDGSPRNFQ